MTKLRNEQETYSRNIGFDMLISYDASKRTEYVGLAYTGAKSSSASWSIYKLTYDVTSGGVDTRRYADGTDDFTKIWDSRTTYDYTP